MMEQYLKPLMNPTKRKIVGRDDEMKTVLATLNRPEISNVMLLGEAGSGKTTLAYGVSELDQDRAYFEVNLSLMSKGSGRTDGSVEMASRLTQLFDELMDYQSHNQTELVLFMDEFHLISELSAAAIEAIKPILANSGSRGIRLILATTYEDFNDHIKKNEALTERLEVLTLPELDFEQTLSALTGYMKRHAPSVKYNPKILREIVQLTDRNVPSQVQPRKSIRVLDGMLGWHNTDGSELNLKLLAKVMKSSMGVDVDYEVDAVNVKKRLNARVFSQSLAVNALTDRILISNAGLNDDGRPRGSLLFTGPTGVGKTELVKAMADVVYGRDDHMIRFDMSEYSAADSADSLRKKLTEEVWKAPDSIILLDEIEKASSECIRLFIQVLDDARMNDEHGREVSFRNNYIVFTTNSGADAYRSMNENHSQLIDPKKTPRLQRTEIRESEQRDLLEQNFKLIFDYLSRQKDASGHVQFPSEILGRIDDIVPFMPVDELTRGLIFKTKMDSLSKTIKQKYGVTLHYGDLMLTANRLYKYIIQECSNAGNVSSGGGREIRRAVDKQIITPVAKALLKHPEVDDLEINLRGVLRSDYRNNKTSSAYIQVRPWRGGEELNLMYLK